MNESVEASEFQVSLNSLPYLGAMFPSYENAGYFPSLNLLKMCMCVRISMLKFKFRERSHHTIDIAH